MSVLADAKRLDDVAAQRVDAPWRRAGAPARRCRCSSASSGPSARSARSSQAAWLSALIERRLVSVPTRRSSAERLTLRIDSRKPRSSAMPGLRAMPWRCRACWPPTMAGAALALACREFGDRLAELGHGPALGLRRPARDGGSFWCPASAGLRPFYSRAPPQTRQRDALFSSGVGAERRSTKKGRTAWSGSPVGVRRP